MEYDRDKNDLQEQIKGRPHSARADPKTSGKHDRLLAWHDRTGRKQDAL